MITNSIKDFISFLSWKNLCRDYNLETLKKKDMINSILQQGINENKINKSIINHFIAAELSRGNNRIMFVSKFKITKTPILQQESFILKILFEKLHKKNTFNELSLEPKDDVSIAYFNYYFDTNRLIEKISICFTEKYKIPGFVNQDGSYITPKNDIDYIWCDINVNEQSLIIKTRDRYSQSKTYRNANAINIFFREKVRELFDLGELEKVGNIKNTLYNIYKDFTDTAEKPYKEKLEPLYNEINSFTNTIVKQIQLPSNTYPVNLPSRIQRLFERALIQHNFDDYERYFEGKTGVVTRIAYSDQTGATVNAKSGDASNEGIAVADIYFDTRDTIDHNQTLDIIWVTWFIHSQTRGITKSNTKISVYSDYFIIHFLYDYVNEEEEKNVFSNFRRFEIQI